MKLMLSSEVESPCCLPAAPEVRHGRAGVCSRTARVVCGKPVQWRVQVGQQYAAICIFDDISYHELSYWEYP